MEGTERYSEGGSHLLQVFWHTDTHNHHLCKCPSFIQPTKKNYITATTTFTVISSIVAFIHTQTMMSY